jgi:hypothetical protein
VVAGEALRRKLAAQSPPANHGEDTRDIYFVPTKAAKEDG